MAKKNGYISFVDIITISDWPTLNRYRRNETTAYDWSTFARYMITIHMTSKGSSQKQYAPQRQRVKTFTYIQKKNHGKWRWK